MTTIGIHFRLMDKDETNAIRNHLNKHAAAHGFLATRGPTAGEGNLAAFLVAIQSGKVFTCMLADAQFGKALARLRKIDEEWAESIVASMELANSYQL